LLSVVQLFKNQTSRGQKRADIPLAIFCNETVRGVE